MNQTVVTVSDLRADVEEMKWDIMRKAVGTAPKDLRLCIANLSFFLGTLAAFVVATIISMELKSLMAIEKANAASSPPPPKELSRELCSEGTTEWAN